MAIATPAPIVPPEMPEGDEPTGKGTVLLTVMSNGDGTYTLQKGDEPDAGGEPFDGPGPLLKAILDMLKADAEGGADATPEANFRAGYGGGDKAE